jgi:SAM-dependent methyltransferase
VVADVRAGLPVESDRFDYATSIHVLPEIPYPDLRPTLEELRRVLRPGGVFRFALPDLDRAMEAYHRGDRAYFHAGDDEARSLGRKLQAQLVWFGVSRTPFTVDFAIEQLERAGFTSVVRCAYRRTTTWWADIVGPDNREAESFFVEARK